MPENDQLISFQSDVAPADVPVAPSYHEKLRRTGDPVVQQQGFAELWDDKAVLVRAWLKKKFFSLTSDQIDVAVSDGFLAVWDIVDKGGIWGETRMASLSGVFLISWRRAADIFRVVSKRGKRLPTVFQPNEDAIRLAYAHGKLTDPDDKRSDEHEEAAGLEFLAHQVQQAVGGFPDQQRRVAEILIENFEDVGLTYEDIQELYHARFNEEISKPALKSAKNQIAEKLAPIYEPYRRRYTTLWHRTSPRRTPT